MKLKRFQLLFLSAIILGIGTGIVSCKDDDDDDSQPRNEEANALDTDEAHLAWRWLSALTDEQTLDANWSNKTYEPTVGEASENNPNTRIVVVSDLDEAKTQFSDLADVKPSELNKAYSISMSGVGKMEWTPSPAGAQNLAEVVVNTKLLPHLQKIVYCTSEQTGVNGIFGKNVDGTAYYRLGDVIKDEQGYYWVCVRPSFYPDKGESHWMNIFNAEVDPGIPQENIYSKYNKLEKYKNNTILLPTALKYKREHILNLSNLFWTIKEPNEYANMYALDNIENDIDHALCNLPYKYHGKNFITAVGNFWDNTYPNSNGKTIYEILFNCKREKLKEINYITFFYKGYSWWIGSSGHLWEFTTGRYGVELFTSESEDEREYKFTDGFDVNKLVGSPNADKFALEPRQFFSDYANYLIRYKTGSQLMKQGDYSPYVPINGCHDVYRFNELTSRDTHTAPVLDDDIQAANAYMPLKEPQCGALLGADGNFYTSQVAVEKITQDQ